MRALHLPEPQVTNIRKSLENSAGSIEIGGSVQRVFSVPDLVAAGFDETTISE